MNKDTLELQNGFTIDVYSLNTVVVGSGAAGLNAANRLYMYGQKDIAIVTEGLKMGTSRNTGSDKQTYYKLTMAGREQDSVYDMAETLYNGGSMHGDIALVEAALSSRAFFYLVDIGVPFPHNRYGEYIGYKTDHDPRQRATSAGPLTSRYMTERLEKQVKNKGIDIFDGYQVIGILTDEEKDKAVGLLTLNTNQLNNQDKRYVAFNCTNIIYATGGPAGIYETAVYPESQTGATGIALEAGVAGRNLTESQYGISSIKFRWNLSGTYQQVLPRYVSTAEDGSDEREFLEEYFDNPGSMLNAIFLKGYQWPFDPRKVKNFGSSLIDILVYQEREIKGRRVWLDYTKNPSWASKDNSNLNFSLLNEEGYEYLKNSEALFGTPIERLTRMNKPAIDLYKDNGIDLSKEYLEIAVCAQHNNGGLEGNIWWESNLKHFFPVGEVNGTHGVYRPGGSALNSGQVGGIRAAQFITTRYKNAPLDIMSFNKMVEEQIKKKISFGESLLVNNGKKSVYEIRKTIGDRMSKNGAYIRSLKQVEDAIKETREQLNSLSSIMFVNHIEELIFAYQNYDLLLTQYVYLSSIKDYIEKGGKSRGSYLIHDHSGQLPISDIDEVFRFKLEKSDSKLNNLIQKVYYKEGKCKFSWEKVRPLPRKEDWFEKVWNEFMADEIIRTE